MSKTTGLAIGDVASISQAIHDILTTAIGSRIKRRAYGSLIPDLIDQPMNPATRLRLQAATVMAIMRWETRITVSRATLSLDSAGQPTVDLEATRKSGPRAGTAVNLAIPLR